MSSKTLTAAAESPPAVDELAPELAEPYRRLLRVLRGSQGMFALVLVESLLSKAANERLLERLGQDLGREGQELRLADVFYEDWDPLAAVERAWRGAGDSVVVVLRGLERTPPAPLGLEKTPRPRAFARLNQVREHLEQRFPQPLIVWCEPGSFGALQRHAPDFFDHFAGLVRFGSPADTVASEVRVGTGHPKLLGGAEISPVAAEGSRSAIRFYEAQIEKSADGSPERVRALLGLAGSLIDLGGSEKPAAAEQALAVVQEAMASLSNKDDPQQWARARYLEGGAYKASGQLEKSKASFEGALEIRRELAAENPETFEKDVAPTLVYLGNVLNGLGARDEARQAQEEALEIYRRLATRQPEAFEPDVAMALNNLGNVRRGLGTPDEARQAQEEALEIYRRLAARQPAAFEPDVAMTLNNLGIVLSGLGARDEARQSFEEALEIKRRLATRHPAAFEPGVAMTLGNLGNVLNDLSAPDEARQAYEEALEILSPLAEKRPAAFGQKLTAALRRYVSVAPADERDRWRQMWAQLQRESASEAL